MIAALAIVGVASGGVLAEPKPDGLEVGVIAPYRYVAGAPNGYTENERPCPKQRNRFAISSGFLGAYKSATTGEPEYAMLAGTTLAPDRRSWRIRVDGGSQGTGLQLYVLCATLDPQLKARRDSAEVLPGDRFDLAARCPKGSHTISWGWNTTGIGSAAAARLLLTEVRMTQNGRGWRLTGYHAGTEPTTGILSSYCSARTPRLTEATAPITSLFTPNDPQIHCGGDIAYAGGFSGSVDPASDSAIYARTVRPDYVGAPGYFVVGLDAYHRRTGAGTGYAYCGPAEFKPKRG